MVFLIVINVILLTAILVYYSRTRKGGGNASLWDPLSAYGAVAALSSIYSCVNCYLGFSYMCDDICTAGDVSPTITSGGMLYALPYIAGCVAFGFLAIVLGLVGYNCFKNTRLRVLTKLVILFGFLSVEMLVSCNILLSILEMCQ